MSTKEEYLYETGFDVFKWHQSGTMHFLSTENGQVLGCTLLCADGWVVWLPENKNPVGTFDSLQAAKNRIEFEL